MNREEFDALSESVLDYQRHLHELQRHERGGTTLGELAESGFPEAARELFSSPEYRRYAVRLRLEEWLGDPEEEWGEAARPSGILYNIYDVCINLVGSDEAIFDALKASPAELGTRASRVLTDRKAQVRVERLRETARLAGELADAYEERLQTERGVRRVQ